jgi:hypothetical protein
MLAIDVAPTFIRYARDAERAEPLGISYLVADATDLAVKRLPQYRYWFAADSSVEEDGFELLVPPHESCGLRSILAPTADEEPTVCTTRWRKPDFEPSVSLWGAFDLI